MRKSQSGARVFMSPEKLSELRADVATRRRNLFVNHTIYGTRSGADLCSLARAILKCEEQSALTTIISTLANGERWTDATTRQLRAALAPLRRSRFRVEANDDPEGLMWHLARLDELVAQHEALRHLETVLALATTERLPAKPSRKDRARHLAESSRARLGTSRPPAA